MESQNYLGIYISRDKATVVYLGLSGRVGKVLGCFSVSVEEQEQANMQVLAGLIAQGCVQRRWSYSDVSVALDCAMFMQHGVHSEFSDPKQIAATIRFDTEEALATDIANIALAFEITSSGQGGSDLTVFTAQRKILSEVLVSLQQHNLDPVTIEPDVSCLSRFICRKAPSAESRQPGTLFGILSDRNGYLVIPAASDSSGPEKASTVRTFLVGSAQDRGELLAREVLVTTALVKSGEPINYFKVFDSTGTVNYQQLSEKLSIEAGEVDWPGASGTESQAPGDSAEPVDYAIAYGAALALSEKGHRVNFRDDFSPFQGKKLKMQQALKFAAICVTVLLVAIGLNFQTQLFKNHKNRSKLRAKFAENYSSVMLGEKLSAKEEPVVAVRKLRSELGRIRDAKKGLITIKGEKAISSKLTLVLTAFNKCAAQTNLNIKSVTITANDIIVTGDTSSRQNTLKFFETLRSNGLDVLKPGFNLIGGRDNFNITLAPK
ncbi:MAG: hypothetical protein HQ580_14110 [Planctomycetes bacterium]|nr:hypothetical protein [Planctomycetota bacterium]